MQTLSVIVIALAVFGTGLNYRYLRAMRLRHPATWESLRRPTLFSAGGSLIMSVPVLRFLWRREYRQVHDADFMHLSALVRAYNALFFVVCITLAAFICVRLWVIST